VPRLRCHEPVQIIEWLIVFTVPLGARSAIEEERGGTSRMWAMRCNRLAPMRFVPFSYFWTCWNDTPTAKRRLAHVQHEAPHAHSTADVFIDGPAGF
jgi:hypothetical protein